MFNYGFEWREALNNLVSTVRTMFFPAVVWATLLQTVFGITMGATGQVVSFALLAAGYVLSFTPHVPITRIIEVVQLTSRKKKQVSPLN